MKKTILMLSILTMTVSCKEQKKTAVDYAVIFGTIKGEPLDKIMFLSEEGRKEITVDSQGKFRDTIKEKEGDYFIADKKRNKVRLFLKKGSETEIKYNNEDFQNTLTITGNKIDKTLYYKKADSLSSAMFGDVFNKKTNIIVADDYARIKAFKKSMVNLIKSSNLSKESKDYEARNNECLYIAYLMNYKAFIESDPTLVYPKGMTQEINSFNFNNEEDYKNIPYYGMIVSNITNMDYYEAKKGLSEKEAKKEIFKTVKKRFTNEHIKNEVIFNHVSFYLQDVKPENLDEYYTTFINFSTNKEHKQKITEIYNEIKQFTPGNPSPKFKNYESIDEKKISLDDFKGKNVLIDCWATWCGPCAKEVPYWKKLEKEFKGKNLVFLSISFDDLKNKKKWRAMVKEKNMSGVHLIADKALKSKFTVDYRVKTLPRFILIDTKGNIVDANAPRPSNPKLKTLLQELKL